MQIPCHPYAALPERQRNLQACQREMDALAGDQGVVITEHADDRMKERLGLPKPARQRAAQRAFDLGKKHSDARGRLKRYLDGKWLHHGTANNVRLHGQFIWFFAGNCLVTLYAIPKDLRGGV